jgi:hypothetical protein
LQSGSRIILKLGILSVKFNQYGLNPQQTDLFF